MREINVFFDEASIYWTKDANENLSFIKRIEREANNELKKRGFISLEDVLDLLGLPSLHLKKRIGWTRYSVINFGIYDISNERKRAFVNGDERSILLNFNPNWEDEV